MVRFGFWVYVMCFGTSGDSRPTPDGGNELGGRQREREDSPWVRLPIGPWASRRAPAFGPRRGKAHRRLRAGKEVPEPFSPGERSTERREYSGQRPKRKLA